MIYRKWNRINRFLQFHKPRAFVLVSSHIKAAHGASGKRGPEDRSRAHKAWPDWEEKVCWIRGKRPIHSFCRVWSIPWRFYPTLSRINAAVFWHCSMVHLDPIAQVHKEIRVHACVSKKARCGGLFFSQKLFFLKKNGRCTHVKWTIHQHPDFL